MVLDPMLIQGHQHITIEENVYVHRFVWLGAYEGNKPSSLVIGKGSCIGNFNHFSCVSKIVLGKKVLTADKVFITDNIHDYRNPELPVMDQKTIFRKDVFIGDGAWIGESVSIIAASVGKNSVVGANSVVTKDIPDYSLAVGSPARVIKTYNFTTAAWEDVNDTNSNAKT